MRSITLLTALLGSTVTCAAGDLDWLHGCWERSGEGQSGNVEMWFAPTDSLLVGLNYDQGRPVFEYLRIENVDSNPVYVAQPGGRPPTSFTAIESGEQRVVFANDEHDYPQRVQYARHGDELKATISAADGSNAISFGWQAVSCASLQGE